VPEDAGGYAAAILQNQLTTWFVNVRRGRPQGLAQEIIPISRQPRRSSQKVDERER